MGLPLKPRGGGICSPNGADGRITSVGSQDVVFKICGSAGDGSISAVEILNRAVASIGYRIMNFDSYPAEIRGFGKSLGYTRIGREKPLTPGTKTDCLIALNDPHAITELSSLSDRSVIIYDSKPTSFHEEDQAIAGFIEPGMIGYGVPLRELSTKAVKSGRSRNIVSLGVVAGLFGFPPDCFEDAINRRFALKDSAVRKSNIDAFRIGYEYAGENLKKEDSIDFGRKTYPHSENISIISGNEAAALACIDAEVRLYAGYPITPATKILEILAKKLPAAGGLVVQTEDEISAIGHVIGAGFAGKRAITATSGPGLCLMTEIFNLAVMAEIPAVVINSQRGGPSTGLPTKTEQADLNLAVFGGSGDSPRPVLAPANVEECYILTKKAFEIAEAFQTPVIVLLDFFLSNRIEDIDTEDFRNDPFGKFSVSMAEPGPDPYQRFKLTESGISPRAVPGMEGCFHAVTGLEHSENGMPSYEMQNHRDMTAKRHRKLDTLLTHWQTPEAYGPDGDLDVGIIAWGSTTGAAMEAIQTLSDKGVKAGGWFPRLMWPLQSGVINAFSDRCKTLYVAEMNFSGQYAGMLAGTLSRSFTKICGVYSEPMPSEDIVSTVMGDVS
jgi:2-oxoglutarate/2-oxoacid ferredoxin oxidoreductase subunit alpha